MLLGFRNARHPHEVLFLVASFLGGLASLLAYDQAASPTVKAIGETFGYGLYAGLLITSGVALVGVFTPNEKGSVLERAGLFGLAMMVLTYSFVVAFKVGSDGSSVILWSWALAGANLWRCHQIGKEIDELQSARQLLNGSSNRKK